MPRTNFAASLAVPALLIALASCAAIEGRETAGQYVDDATITATVKKDLLADKQIASRQISVETMQGVVQLSGFVDSTATEQKAVTIASKVAGVTIVKDSLVVRGTK